jgi:hypothetical protein
MESGLQIPWSTVVIAKYLGQVLTAETAKAMALEISHGPCAPVVIDAFPAQAFKGYTIQLERFCDIQAELHVLHQLHYTETETYRAGIPMNPDYAAMAKRERGGLLLQATARVTATGELVGNMRVYLGSSTHTQTLFCTEDTFYVVPAHRGGFLAVRLWQYVERAVIALGVREIFFDSKTVNSADSMARYLKYQAIGIKFAKVIPASTGATP